MSRPGTKGALRLGGAWGSLVVLACVAGCKSSTKDAAAEVYLVASALPSSAIVRLPPPDAGSRGPNDEVVTGEDDGFVDLAFFLAEAKMAEGGTLLRGVGRHGSSTVELVVRLASRWTRAEPVVGLDIGTTFTGDVHLVRGGEASDALLRVMSALYGFGAQYSIERASTRFAAVSLHGDPGELAAGPVKLKLFFASSQKSEYAELYLNVDLEARRLELREKSTEYRAAILRALTAPR